MPTNCNRIYYALRIAVRRLPACDGPITAISPVPLYATGHFCVRNCPGRTRDAPSEGKIGLIQFRFPASSHVGWHRIPPLPAKLISGGGRLPLPAVPPNALDGSRAAIRSIVPQANTRGPKSIAPPWGLRLIEGLDESDPPPSGPLGP